MLIKYVKTCQEFTLTIPRWLQWGGMGWPISNTGKSFLSLVGKSIIYFHILCCFWVNAKYFFFVKAMWSIKIMRPSCNFTHFLRLPAASCLLVIFTENPYRNCLIFHQSMYKMRAAATAIADSVVPAHQSISGALAGEYQMPAANSKYLSTYPQILYRLMDHYLPQIFAAVSPAI